MPPDRGRASQACTACRKQKTRCYASSGNGRGGCLRCERLRLSCSLELPTTPGHQNLETRENYESVTYNDRLSRLEHVVNTVVERLDSIAPRTSLSASANRPNVATHVVNNAHVNNSEASVFTGGEEGPPAIVSTAPVFVIRDVAREVGASPQDERHSNANVHGPSFDIINNGLLGLQDAISLLTLFLEHYGRWVAFQETISPKVLLVEVRKSPLLLCTCCLIAVRHTTEENAAKLAPILFQEAKSLLSTALLVVPQSMAFFQAALILSLWSTTVGQAVMSIDSWLLSGFVLQHCFSSDLFASVTNTTQSQPSPLTRQQVSRWFIWNHLCVVHLQYCVGTRRKAMLDREQVEICRRVLDSDQVTNFETRMVAEVNLYWIIYESCSAAIVDVPGTQVLFNSWKQEWKFLFDQPRPQFIQMAFHFGQLLVYEKALKSRSAKVRESLLSEMVRLSAAIITLTMDTADIRTQHLTDHIYHVITFAAVTLCRLLHMYEDQLAQSHNILELDQLILNLVAWLQSIGLPCHVSHTLGGVVSAFHEKLRPNARPTPNYEEADPWVQFDLSLFSDLHGIELFHDGNGAFFSRLGTI